MNCDASAAQYSYTPVECGGELPMTGAAVTFYVFALLGLTVLLIGLYLRKRTR